VGPRRAGAYQPRSPRPEDDETRHALVTALGASNPGSYHTDRLVERVEIGAAPRKARDWDRAWDRGGGEKSAASRPLGRFVTHARLLL